MKHTIYRVAGAVLLYITMTTLALFCGIESAHLAAEPVAALDLPSSATSQSEPEALPPLDLSFTVRPYPAMPAPLTLSAFADGNALTVTVLGTDGQPVSGVRFTLVLSASDEQDAVYEDEDANGEVVVEGLAKGDYTVSLQALPGYASPKPVSLRVSGPVEYVAIADIADKIVAGSEVDAAAEDPGYQNAGGGQEVVLGGDGQSSQPSAPSSSSSSSQSSGAQVTLTDTVEFIASQVVSQDKTSLVPLTDANGNAVYRYRAVTGTDGCILLPSGQSSGLTPVNDADGYLLSARDAEGAAAAVLDAAGAPLLDGAGQLIYQIQAVAQTTTLTETVTTYYGWQTLAGNTYYYDKNGAAVTGEQVIQGVLYIFDAQGILRVTGETVGSSSAQSSAPQTTVGGGPAVGIDVSVYQGAINWSRVKAAGVDYVMIRIGFRGWATGLLVEDSTFRQNIAGAAAAGLKVGVYFFTQAITTAEAVEEASMVISLLRGYAVQYPVAFDTEYAAAGARANNLTASQRTAIAIAFCETIRNAGYTPMVYASASWFLNNLAVTNLGAYKIWLAHYTAATNFPYTYDMWQYTANGSVGGIAGSVDLNWGYLPY